ncbi:MAG: hypothetical protein ABI333_23815 [bacterium]
MVPKGGHLAGALVVAVAALLLIACRDEDNLLKKRKKNRAGDYITRVRGAKGRSQVPELLGASRPVGGGTVARLLIQPLEPRLIRGRFVRVLYVSSPADVADVRRAMLHAKPAPFRTCEPTWRIDVRYGHHTHIARVNLSCQRLQVDGRSLAYDGDVAKVLGPFLRHAIRRPSHKLLRVRVPVEHEPTPILKALASRAVEAYLPEKPVRRGPHRRIFYSVLKRPPQDSTKLDQVVADLRRAAYSRLKAYAYQIKVGRHEVIDVQGPEVVFERFNDRVFEAKYGVTVLFKLGTPEYMLGFLGLGNNFQVGKPTFPKAYRLDVIFGSKERYAKMRMILGTIKLKPPLRPL